MAQWPLSSGNDALRSLNIVWRFPRLYYEKLVQLSAEKGHLQGEKVTALSPTSFFWLKSVSSSTPSSVFAVTHMHSSRRTHEWHLERDARCNNYTPVHIVSSVWHSTPHLVNVPPQRADLTNPSLCLACEEGGAVLSHQKIEGIKYTLNRYYSSDTSRSGSIGPLFCQSQRTSHYSFSCLSKEIIYSVFVHSDCSANFPFRSLPGTNNTVT